MVIRGALREDSANDGLTLTSRVRIVCQDWARGVSGCTRVRGRPRADNVSVSFPYKQRGLARATIR
jgi:hypothetical protein